MKTPSKKHRRQPTKLLLLIALLNTLPLQAITTPSSPLLEKTNNSILLKDPFGGHYEEITIKTYQQTAQGDTIKIPYFQGKKQGTGPWCWAAAASMMLYHKAIKKKPCEIASEYLKKNCCSWTSSFLGSWDCWKGGNVANALAHYGVASKTITRYQLPSPTKTQKVLEALQKGKPSTLILECTNFKNRPGSYQFHAVVVYGASNLSETSKRPLELLIYDPLTGPTSVTTAKLNHYKNDYQRGACSYRWHSTLFLQ